MKLFYTLAATTALVAGGSVASAEAMKIGITQNNVGVDSYQTTYEKAFIAAAEENPDVEAVEEGGASWTGGGRLPPTKLRPCTSTRRRFVPGPRPGTRPSKESTMVCGKRERDERSTTPTTLTTLVLVSYR